MVNLVSWDINISCVVMGFNYLTSQVDEKCARAGIKTGKQRNKTPRFGIILGVKITFSSFI